MVLKMYQGHGDIKESIRQKHGIAIFDSLEEEEEDLREWMMPHQMVKNQSLSKKKSLMPAIISLPDDSFETFLDNNRDKTYKDATLIINQAYCLPTNKSALAMSSQYFRNLFSANFKGKSSFHVTLPTTNLVVFEMVINYLLLDKLVIPVDMGVGSWMELYEMAEFLCLGRLMTMCEQQICSMVHEENCD